MKNISLLIHLISQKGTRYLIFYALLHLVLKPFDGLFYALLKKKYTDAYNEPPLIFIIGLPRSGTTILYQYLSYYYDVAYTSNFWSIMPKSGPYLRKILNQKPPNEKKSFYGNGFKMSSVQEGGNIFSQWFTNQQYHYLEELATNTQKNIQNYFNQTYSTAQKPILIKNTRNCVRIKALSDSFPNSIFIHIDRDNMEIAKSLYKGRIDLYNDVNKNFTVVPKEWNSIKDLSIEKQISHQVYYLKKNIEEAFEQIEGNRVFKIEYEEFCQNPNSIVQRINQIGTLKLKERTLTSDINKVAYKSSKSKQLSDEIYTKIKDELIKLNEQN